MRLTFTAPLQTPPSRPTSLPNWSEQPQLAAQQAMDAFALRQKGWRGFDALPWVQAVKDDFPAAVQLAQTCSAHRPEYREQARELFANCSPADRLRLRDYFLGKLALEELSCQMSGAGAGMCDKRTAFQEIYSVARQSIQPAEVSAALYL